MAAPIRPFLLWRSRSPQPAFAHLFSPLFCCNNQGEKAASNAGIPFVVVGRKMSAENFKKALLPHVEPHSAAAAAAAQEAAADAAKAAANKAAADAFFQSAATWSRLSR